MEEADKQALRDAFKAMLDQAGWRYHPDLACPFLDDCLLRSERCPSTEQPKPQPFSCAAARAFSLLLENRTDMKAD